MIDVSKADKEYSKLEAYAIDYLNEHGYDGVLLKQYMSKTKFDISKDGVEYKNFETPNIPMSDENCKKFMEQFEDSFELLRKLKEKGM